MTRRQQFADEVAEQVAKHLNLQMKEVLTIAEAEAYTGLNRSTLYKYVQDGRLACHRPDGQKRPVFFKREDLIEFMTRGRQESYRGLERKEFKRRAS